MGLKFYVTLAVLFLAGCSVHQSPRIQRAFNSTLSANSIFTEPITKTVVSIGSGAAIPIGRRDGKLLAIAPRHLISQPGISVLLGISFNIDVLLSRTRRGKLVKATVEKTLNPADAILISVPDKEIDVRIPRISKEYPRRGDIVFSIGHPGSSSALVNQAIVAGRCGINCSCASTSDKVHGYLVDRPLFPGHSGGPVFNTRGELIGMLTELVMLPHPADESEPPFPAWGVFLSARDIVQELERE